MTAPAPDGGGSGPGSSREASERKEGHLSICVDDSRFHVETRAGGAGFARMRLAHRAFSELSFEKIDASVDFLGSRLSMPFLVSCMTGGSAGGQRVNRELALAAAEARVAFGLGSFRSLLRDRSRLEDFRVKSLLGDLPLLANIGAVTLREAGAAAIVELARAVEADAIVVHLNAGQELFQPGGDRDFRGLRDAIIKLVDASPMPVIAKETGFGFASDEIERLLSRGVSWVDLAGAGGTNWITVEAYRNGAGPLREAASDFDEWGQATALLLAAATGLGKRSGSSGARIIASGGLRSGVEVAKALALGAGMTAMALPLVRAVERKGREGAVDFLSRVSIGLRAAMLLSGSRDIAALRRGILILDPDFEREARAMTGEGLQS